MPPHAAPVRVGGSKGHPDEGGAVTGKEAGVGDLARVAYHAVNGLTALIYGTVGAITDAEGKVTAVTVENALGLVTTIPRGDIVTIEKDVDKKPRESGENT